jgi:hypothetical protein
VLAVVLLVGTIGWKATGLLQAKNTALSVVAPASAPRATTTENTADTVSDSILGTSRYSPETVTDGLTASLASTYATLKRSGSYSTTTSIALAEHIGQNVSVPIVSKVYATSDVRTDADTSYERMLAYRLALQKSLAPLMGHTTNELDTLRTYENTHDARYLDTLSRAAVNYHAVATATALIPVPVDGLDEHVAILNALSQFASTLDTLVAHADDPIAEAALLTTYMQAQQTMFTSFNSLYAYWRSKQV